MSKGMGQFTAVRVEGSLLSPDLLGQLMSYEVEGTRPESYHLASGERITESVSRTWNRMRAAWGGLQSLRQQAREDAAATGTTRERFLLPMFQELGYGRLQASKGLEIDGRAYPVSHLWQHTPIHLIGFGVDLDRRSAGVAGAARMSPHGMIQELLNRSEEHLWALLSNGLRLRILRDNRSLTRQAYIEFDLEAIFDGELYPDFVLLWLLCHQSRVEGERPAACWLERWSELGYQQGARALDALRGGVENAIRILGAGFLAHRANGELREELRQGTLDGQEFYRQVLRLVYRLIFLFVAEDRGALLDPKAAKEDREIYQEYYSATYLRGLAERLRGGSHADLYEGLKTVMVVLGSEGSKELGLPALGSYLWSDTAIGRLKTCCLSNHDLLEAIRALGFTQRNRMLWRVDYRNLGSEELGSIYESLLELHPVINLDAANFELRVAAGHERKTTGSYYTPRSLVQSLLDTALEPVLEEKLKSKNQERSLLATKICDPACGSGHFLIAAAHRIARRLAAVRTGDEEPAPDAMRSALRDVIGHCIYGVDVNPMAVELCKVSLWMEALEPGKPLSFLDHHIQCGNSLLGTTPELIAGGIPQEAFKVLTGDDKTVVSALKKRNKEERSGQLSLITAEGQRWEDQPEVLSAIAQLDRMGEESLQAVRRLEEQYENLVGSAAYSQQRSIADAWCAAFVWPKRKGAPPSITEELFERIRRKPESVPEAVGREIRTLAGQYRFFHWHLAYPEVFGGKNAGFDAVLGNPPWERIKIQEIEWFSERDPEIASSPNAAERKRRIKRLRTEDSELFKLYQEALRQAEGASALVRDTGRYPLCGRGDVNTYSIFTELNRSLMAPNGRVGIIVPSGVATDDTTKFFFADLVEKESLVSLYDFENRKGIFPGVHRSYKFCLLTLTGLERPAKEGAEFVFFALDSEELADSERRFRLEPSDFELMNPNTRTCPIFRSRRDAELTRSIYNRVPVLIKEGDPEENPWGISFMAMLHMANDSGLFRTRDQLQSQGYRLDGARFVRDGETYLPLYEAKMLHHFDHRVADVEKHKELANRQQQPKYLTDIDKSDPTRLALPYFWVAESEVDDRLVGRWNRGWLIGWRDITSTTNERTVLSSVFPRSGVGDTELLMFPSISDVLCIPLLVANLNSYVLDYSARQKVGGTHLKYHVFKQLPVLLPQAYYVRCPWEQSIDVRDWFLPRVLELVYTAHDLESFALDFGYDGSPFKWDPERRFRLRCELDAAFFHLYGINRSDVEYIMETFPIVKRHDEQEHGQYRTKDEILSFYDRFSNTSIQGKQSLDIRETARGVNQEKRQE